jgi:EAL domain-containing protein (putative c-di-GMP-specific phosphodiesterase class I)
MYEAKASGRNAVRVFAAGHTHGQPRARLEAELHGALERDELLVHFQPLVDVAGRIRGAEAVLRWQHPRQGLLLPAQFIGPAESAGLLPAIEQWLLERVCAQLPRWHDDAEMGELFVAVNLNPRQLSRSQFVGQTLAMLARSGASPARLRLKIEQSMLDQMPEVAIASMHALRAQGLRFVLDKFGASPLALNALRNIPFDQLNLDRSCVSEMGSDPRVSVIAGSLAALGRGFGMTVLAEGVENVTQRTALAEVGVDLFVGGDSGRALSASELQHAVRRSLMA